ncbi:methyltransferase domain-containing protein [archaeon]|nr:methyltransferase domain-containing protein [archaeon]MBL7056972.1 methyltransferase domain-containing protein [Candidatus Woesearchaeota archaeon]
MCQEPKSKKDTSFIIKLFKKYGKIKSVLDVGCGVGSHVKHLHDKGYNAEGVEADPAKVKFSKKNYPNLKFGCQSMQTLNMNKEFDAIICINNIIAFNKTNEEVFRTFKNFNKHLKKGGLLLVQTKNAMGLIENRVVGRRVDTGKDRTAMGIKAIIEEKVDVTKQRLIGTRTFLRLKDNKKVGSYTKSSRLYFPQELIFFLEQAGFEVLDHYGGDLSKATLKDKELNKPKMLFIAKKK